MQSQNNYSGNKKQFNHLRLSNSFINVNNKQPIKSQTSKQSKVDSCINKYLQDKKKVVKTSEQFKNTPTRSYSKENIERINQSYDNRFDHIRSVKKDDCELNYLSFENNISTQDITNGSREDFDLTFSGKNKNNSVYFEDDVVKVNTVKNSNFISIEELNNYSGSKNPNLKLDLKSIVNNEKDQ